MIQVIKLPPPRWDTDEILRYARSKDDDSIKALLNECIGEAESVLEYKVDYSVVDVVHSGAETVMANMRLESKTLDRTVNGCDKAVVFAATVGSAFDRLIAKHSKLSPSKALIMQAIGAERAEALCDAFCDWFSENNGVALNTRVSPGYGDLSLELQRDIFALLDCPRKIGLTLNSSLLMSPSKSVTAIAGIKRSADGLLCQKIDKCQACENTDCIYRT